MNRRKYRAFSIVTPLFYSVSDLVVLLHKTGFADFSYQQTLFPGKPTDITVREGFGDGSFVVIKTHKSEGEDV